MGVTCVNANYDFILTELLRFLGANDAFHQASSASLLRSTPYFTARCKDHKFTVNAHAEWYYDFYLQNRMNVYQYLNKRAVLDYLARWCPFPGWDQHCSVPQQNFVASANQIVLPGDADVMQLIRYHAEVDLSFFEQRRLAGFVFDFGYQRLGGVFLSFDEATETIAIDYPFVRCDAKRSNFLMRLLAHFIRAQGYYPQFKQIKRVIPCFLAKYFEPLLLSTQVERIDDVGRALGFAPGVLIQYTWKISELLKLLA